MSKIFDASDLPKPEDYIVQSISTNLKTEKSELNQNECFKENLDEQVSHTLLFEFKSVSHSKELICVCLTSLSNPRRENTTGLTRRAI